VHRSRRRLQPEFGKIDAQTKGERRWRVNEVNASVHSGAARSGTKQSRRFLMTQVTLDEHVASLLSGMNLEEKIGQLTMMRGGSGAGGAELSDGQLDELRAGRVGSILDLWSKEGMHRAQEVAVKETRLSIPLLICLDVLHGYETTFPIPLGEAAAFDPALWEATARVAAEEASAAEIALTFAPMLDVSRDVRWGRMAEGPGEDPWLASRFAEAKIRGFQRDLSSPGTLAATAKHLGAYGAVTAGREYNAVDISARNLHEVHLPPFAASVRAGVAAIMPSFNDLAGVPMTAHTAILRGLIRERWGFDGVIISDFSATAELVAHGVAADLVEAAALALKAGIDIDMVSDVYPKGLPVALERGLVEQRLVDEAVRRVLMLKARLGLFGDPFRQHSKADGATAASRRTASRALARDAARRSIVLLQNRGGVLPLRGEGKRLAVLGPLADNAREMLGPWFAAGKPEEMKSFLSGIREALPGWEIDHAAGGSVEEKDPASLAIALEAASNADLIVLCLGEGLHMSGEAASRARPELPQWQRQFAEAVFAWRKPVIVTLSSGRPVTAPWLFDGADAVLATWFLGSEAGTALADILTGRVNPSGKLPISWPVDVGQAPIFYAQRPTGRPRDPNNNMTSRYIDMPNEPLFSFGHGLSYTRFVYRALRLSRATIGPGETISVEADIANEGAADGEETALLFIRDPVASVTRPVLELKGMARIALRQGASGTVRFDLSAEDVSFPDESGRMVLEAGAIEVMVGPKADRAVLIRETLQVRAV
jgi:beta-glucosidase